MPPIQSVLTAAQMREIEGTAIRSGAVSGLGLMEVAARGVVETTLRH
jgi:ADP-dependent NAD(P)H-hydrate dehydratase / NAD(P)H-hydrate epimerase